MAMAEFFLLPVLGFFLRAVDAFPADRYRADRKTIRTAIQRLKQGRIIGLFPEGGIRDGPRSLLEGAPLRAGASTLAHLSGVPILPCVIVGSDRLYSKKSWLPLRRTPIWIAFGDPISDFPGLAKSDARECIERDLTTAFKNLYLELRQTFRLSPDDLPHPPRERHRSRRFFPLCARLERADRADVARAHVGEPHRISPLGGALQRTRLECVLRASAVSLFSGTARLLERRTRHHCRSHSQRRGI